MLAVGSKAPDFSASLDDGSVFNLEDYRGKKNVVLYFYPKDFTSGCTKEACSFRDNYYQIAAFDAIIVGVSADAADRHTSFREKHNLPFPLIADPRRELIARYDVKGMLSFIPPRVTYVIDKQGIIRSAIRHDIQIGRHVDEVIEALRGMEPAPA
jgi:thioredoxin-dependent peroxiredoxin